MSRNGAFSLLGKTSDCGSEEQGSIPESTPKTGKITEVVCPPWTREVAGSNPASQTYQLQEWRNGIRDRFRICFLRVRISLPVQKE